MHAVVSDEDGEALPEARGLGSWLQTIAPREAQGVVHIAIVPDARIRALNRQFRGKDAPTDVLSFPVDLADAKRRDTDHVRAFLGDIIIARGVAKRQARHAGHPYPTELRVLALHGLLHLLGYDHEHDDGRMRRVEARLRRKGGLSEGLIERSRQGE